MFPTVDLHLLLMAKKINFNTGPKMTRLVAA